MRKLLLSGLLLLFAWPASAQHGDWCACGRHSTEPAFFQIDHTVTSFQNAAATSFNRWDRYSDVFSWGIGNGAGGSNGTNEIIFFGAAATFNQYGIVIDSNVFGVTYINPSSAFGNPPFNACPPPAGTTCGFFSETDVIMNAEFSRGWTTSPPNYSDTGPAYYIATAIHEMGHALGIHHNFDSLTTMNYYEDYAALYLSHSDGRAARGYHATQARTTVDIGTYPFRFSGFQYSGTTVASSIPSSVEQGALLTVRNFTIENIGSETLSNVRLRLYLSTNDIITGADYLLGTVSFSSFSTWWDTTGTNFTVPSSVPAGTYYLGAIASYNTSQEDAITYNNSWVLDASRRVTVTSSACSPDGFEPDNSSGQAKTISSGIPKNHNICPVGDEDWSTFTLASESGVTLQTSGVAGDTRMWLRNAAGSQIEFDDDDGSGLFSLIDRTCGIDPLPAGTYFVQVDEFGDNDEIESYALALTAASCGGCPADLVYANQTLSGSQTLEASSSITLGPNLIVNGTHIVTNAPLIRITSGTEIGGSFSAGTNPSCP